MQKSTQFPIVFFHIPLVLTVIILTTFVALSLFLFLGREMDTNISVIETGSMGPAITKGSIVLTVKSSEYKVNDVITYRALGQDTGIDLKTNVTHRIIAYTEDNETIIVKGDANELPDEALIKIEQIIGKVSLVIPFLGYLLIYLGTLKGFIFLIAIPGISLIIWGIHFIISGEKVN